MPKPTIRRTGNALGLPIPEEIAREYRLSDGDEVLVTIRPIPKMESMAGRLKGRFTADEFTRLSNQGEDLG